MVAWWHGTEVLLGLVPETSPRDPYPMGRGACVHSNDVGEGVVVTLVGSAPYSGILTTRYCTIHSAYQIGESCPPPCQPVLSSFQHGQIATCFAHLDAAQAETPPKHLLSLGHHSYTT